MHLNVLIKHINNPPVLYHQVHSVATTEREPTVLLVAGSDVDVETLWVVFTALPGLGSLMHARTANAMANATKIAVGNALGPAGTRMALITAAEQALSPVRQDYFVYQSVPCSVVQAALGAAMDSFSYYIEDGHYYSQLSPQVLSHELGVDSLSLRWFRGSSCAAYVEVGGGVCRRIATAGRRGDRL